MLVPNVVWMEAVPMLEKSQSVSPEIETLIKATVKESMGRYALRRIDVRAGEDHDGDPVIFVEAAYGLSKLPIDTRVTAALRTKLRNRLWENGETRFPHLSNKYHPRQEVKQRRRLTA